MPVLSRLRCEYAENPLGLDVSVPRFSWQVQTARRGAAQAAYRLRVAGSPAALAATADAAWDSGWVALAQTVNVEYRGPLLLSGQRCYWTVAVRDEAGAAVEAAEPAWFEMGLLHAADWRAEWVGVPASWHGRGLLLRREFDIDKPVRRARLYAAGLGFCELRLNGVKLGEAVLEPAPTDTAKRVPYVTHDITAGLRPGRNVIGAMLGNGWYGAPKLCLQAELTFEDGATRRLTTAGDETPMLWKVAPGPIVCNGIYDGEDYDARLDRAGWDLPDAPLAGEWQAGGWMAAMAADAPGGRLISATVAEPIRVVETIRPRAVNQPGPGVFVFDLGRNIAGWARLRVKGPSGTRVGLAFAETLRDDGTINRDNLRSARAADSYTLKGAGSVETWEPRFTYHGFRYVQVEGWPGVPTVDDLDGRVVRSGVAGRGTFTCDSELISRLHAAVVATEAGNLHGVPTDCPQRDERMGWLNDLTARSEEALQNFELARFLTKFLADIGDAQDPASGELPCTVPHRFGSRPTDPVCIAYLLLPWLMYRHYGDRRLIEQHYPGMRAWVDALAARSENGILRLSHYGDWAPPAVGEQAAHGSDAHNHTTPGALVSTGFLFYHARLLAELAGILRKGKDRRRYAALAESVRYAFDREFWDEAAGGYGRNNQSANALALYVGLVPEARVARVVDNLVRDVVEKFNGHLTTGNICTKYLLEALSAQGRSDVAYRLATQTSYPSWGFMLANGATTIWERWEKATGSGMNSHNHPMLASVGAWLYRHLAGLQVDPHAVACDRFVIRPYFAEGLGSAAASLDTVRGPASCAWERQDGGIRLRLTVPVGASAQVELPATARHVVEEGRPLKDVPGVGQIRRRDGKLSFVIASGQYDFVVRAVTKVGVPTYCLPHK